MLQRVLQTLRRSRRSRLALHVEPRVTAEDRFVLQHLLTHVARPDGIVIEVGSFLGNGSTQSLLEVIRPLKGTLYCVDTWRGNDNVPWHLQLAEKYDLFATFRHHVGRADGLAFVKPMMMTSRDAA